MTSEKRIYRSKCPKCGISYLCDVTGLKLNPAFSCICGSRFICEPENFKGKAAPEALDVDPTDI